MQAAEIILKYQTFRLSEFSKMNDSSEYLYAKQRFIEAFMNRHVWIEEVPRYLVSGILEMHEPATIMLIGCLTEDKDDIGLWERYAANGEGCVIGFDAHWLAKRAGITLKRVSYNPTDIRDFVNAGLMMLQKQYEKSRQDLQELINLATFFILDLYAFKDPRFRSEMEIRISRLAATDADAPFGLADVVGHRDDYVDLAPLPVGSFDSRYGPKRFIDVPVSDIQTGSAIRSVGLGPKAKSSDMEAIIKACEAYPNIDVWRSDAPLR
ncbi:hypothetical protein HB770_19975 [Rhizobium leguminosarum bv. viciae]|uniref:DUF2971 domain-containing protein n=1 Tax=Rhizobium leguminosarum bv. viciae TaxID=387 RepID=A0A7G6RKW0_RHILV|nr:hypothetical protein HB770_19975 [Rhizobium leguminosarum bv. viciae]